MKKQLNQHRDQLIDHIQSELAALRARRSQLEQPRPPSHQKQREKIVNSDVQFKRVDPHQQRSVQMNINTLGELYRTKKQLQGVGIITNNPSKLNQFKTDPKLISQVQKKKKRVEQQAAKNKVIEEQMRRTEKFLKNRHTADRQLSQLQLMNYRYLFKERTRQLKEYEALLRKNGLTRLQKSELSSKTFELIKEWNDLVRVDYFKKFLLANPQFCRHFFITHAEINRDLDVYLTEEKGYMSETELFEFVKSIEITNPNLDPALKNRMKREIKSWKENDGCADNQSDKKDGKKGVESEKIDYRKEGKKILQYLRRVFKSLDRLSEGVVDRKQYILGLQKSILNEKKQVKVTILEQLAKQIRSYTQQKSKTTYYRELDAKFITFSEIQAIFKQYWKKKQQQDKRSEKKLEQDIEAAHILVLQAQQQIEEKNERDSSEDQQQSVFKMPKNGNIQDEDFQRYGWKDEQQPIQSDLKQLDQYYGGVRERHLAEIEWEGFDHYKADFKQLQMFIREQESKGKK